MKKTIITGVLAALGLVCGACERHKWEETKALHAPHGGGHGASEEHAKGDAGHGEASDAAGGETKKADH